MRKILALIALTAPAFAGDQVSQVFDNQVTTIEREVLGLAKAMPADKYDFAPTNGTFTGVRTFGQEVSHAATYVWRISASVLNEKTPIDTGAGDNGPATLKTKDDIIKYFEDSLAYAHKAMGSITAQNMLDQVVSPFGRGMQTRLASAAFLGMHTNDHYGQMVEYARMNGVVPGASQGRGPAGGKGAPKGKR